MPIPVILLNYNSASDCEKCVSFLKRQKEVELEIVIVDNCSATADRQRVKALCAREGLIFLPAAENRGYNAGNNIGLRYAAEKGYEFALIANPDMEFPETDYIVKLVKDIQEHPEAVAVGSDITNPDGMHQNPMLADGNWTSSFGWIRDFLPKKKTRDAYDFIGDYTKSGECSKISGCALMVRLDFMKEIGYFDEYPFLYCEEAIFAKQVEATKRAIRYNAEAHAFHRHVKSEKGDPRPRLRQWKRSRIYYFLRYSGYPWYGKLLSIASRQVYHSIMNIAFTLKRR